MYLLNKVGFRLPWSFLTFTLHPEGYPYRFLAPLGGLVGGNLIGIPEVFGVPEVLSIC